MNLCIPSLRKGVPWLLPHFKRSNSCITTGHQRHETIMAKKKKGGKKKRLAAHIKENQGKRAAAAAASGDGHIGADKRAPLLAAPLGVGKPKRPREPGQCYALTHHVALLQCTTHNADIVCGFVAAADGRTVGCAVLLAFAKLSKFGRNTDAIHFHAIPPQWRRALLVFASNLQRMTFKPSLTPGDVRGYFAGTWRPSKHIDR